MKAWRSVVAGMLCIAMSLPMQAQGPFPAANQPSSPGPFSPSQQSTSGGKTFSQQELDQILAPIALYPDSLLAQVLMASTYPLEVVMADRWVKANPGLKGKALEDALQSQTWEPAVKSLTVLPQVLTMMSEKLDWTYKLGDAFLAQPKDVMATAQALRRKAIDAGNLKDTKEQKVVQATEDSVQVIRIEPTNPEVVYVPTYDPTHVYGTWPYPAYPPYYWYPPGYAYSPGLWFATGVLVGAALWGNCIWGGGSVNINANRYNNFNRSNISNGNWNHRVDHRGGVPYRDQKVAQQYGRGQRSDAASREAFRGRADSGRQAMQRGDAGSRDVGGRNTAATRDAGGRNTAGTRDVGRGSNAGSGTRDYGGRDTSGVRSPTAFDTGSRGQASDYSSRGSSSVGSSRSSGNLGGGGRSGGGSRGGGGGRGRR